VGVGVGRVSRAGGVWVCGVVGGGAGGVWRWEVGSGGGVGGGGGGGGEGGGLAGGVWGGVGGVVRGWLVLGPFLEVGWGGFGTLLRGGSRGGILLALS
jgi:hypothetical protein